MTRIDGVILDIGETIRDDTAEFGAWADWLGVPRHTLSALIGATRAQGGSTDEAFRLVCPDFDRSLELGRRRAAGIDEHMGEADLYPDVRPCMKALRSQDVWVAVAGNQSRRIGELLQNLDLPIDEILVSAAVGFEKPDPAFFQAVVDRAPHPAGALLHVGDNWSNDVTAAVRSGMLAAHLRRGPMGYLAAKRPTTQSALWQLQSLDELPDLVQLHNASEEVW